MVPLGHKVLWHVRHRRLVLLLHVLLLRRLLLLLLLRRLLLLRGPQLVAAKRARAAALVVSLRIFEATRAGPFLIAHLAVLLMPVVLVSLVVMVLHRGGGGGSHGGAIRGRVAAEWPGAATDLVPRRVGEPAVRARPLYPLGSCVRRNRCVLTDELSRQ